MGDYNQGLKGMQWSMKHFVAPCYGFGDNLKGYLKWAQPRDLENINVPFLIFDTLSDFVRNPDHILSDFCELNENIIHIINKKGAHCIRREGVRANICWISKVTFSFSDYVVHQHSNVKK